MYKTTTIGATQKCSSWKGGHLIKSLYQATTTQIWLFLPGFSFFNGECFTRNKDFHIMVPFLKIKSVSVTFDFECTYVKEVQYNCSAHCSAHIFLIAINSDSHKGQKEPQFFFQFVFLIQTEYREILIQRDTRIQVLMQNNLQNV